MIDFFKKQETLLVAIFFLLFWFGILIVTGTLTSGFHFTDDHDVVRINKDLEKTSIGRELTIFSNGILRAKHRFRPFYQFHRRMATAVLGVNFTSWSIYTGLLAVFTSLFLFLALRKAAFSFFESGLFVMLTLLGDQAAIWWKLGANETLGIFVFSLALFFMVQSVVTEHPRHKKIYNGLFLFFALLATWSKESFILMLPALAAMQILLTWQRDPSLSFWQALKSRWLNTLLLALVCLVELLNILLLVGTMQIKYAGYEGFRLSVFLGTFWHSLKAFNGWIIIVPVISVFYGIFRQYKQIGFDSSLKKNACPLFWSLVVSLLIVVPQLVLYMKSGIYERYLIPAMIGYALLIASLLKYLRLQAPPAKKGLKGRGFEIVVMVILAMILVQELREVRYTALAFTREGRLTGQWLESIKKNTSPDDHLLVVTPSARYTEAAVALKTYLSLEMDRKKLLFIPPSQVVKNHGYWKSLNNSYLSHYPRIDFNNTGFDAVLIFPGLEKKFLKLSSHWFHPEKYNRYEHKYGYISFY